MKHHARLWIVLVTLVLLAIGAVLVLRPHGPVSTLKRTSIQIDWKAEPLYAGIWVAKAKGYFSEAGFEVDILQGNGAALATQVIGVGNGPVIGTANGAQTAIARSKGIPVKSVAVLYPHTATVMVSLPRAPIATPKDMVGKRVGLIPGTVTTNEYRALLEANAIERSTVSEVQVDWNVTPLLTGDVDGLIFYEDNVPVQLQLTGNNPVVMRFRDYGVDVYSLNIIVNETAYGRDEVNLDKLVKAILKGYEDLRRDPDEAAAIFLKEFPERDAAYVRASMKVVAGLLGESQIGTQTKDGWEKTLRTLNHLGMLEKDVASADVWVTP